MHKVSFIRFLSVLIGCIFGFLISVTIIFVSFKLLAPDIKSSYLVEAPFSNLLFLIILCWLLNTFIFSPIGASISQGFSLATRTNSLAHQIWIGLQGWLWLFMVVAVVCALLFAITKGDIDQFTPGPLLEITKAMSLPQTALHLKVLIFINCSVLTVLVEECFCRGFIYNWLRSRMKFWSAAVISGLVFGSLHGLGSSLIMYVDFPIKSRH